MESYNKIMPSEAALEGMEVGEPVEMSIKGIVADKDGRKCVKVTEVDGEPVEMMEASEMTPEEGIEESRKKVAYALKGNSKNMFVDEEA